MRVPMSWLAESATLTPQSTPETVMAELVKIGLEEEGVHRFDVTGPLVVGEVLEFIPEPQSNGKTIRWCQVRVAPSGKTALDGGADVRGIVCGASNFAVGDKVVVCLPGAVLPGGFAIAARSTYGHTSDGMLASGRELGLNDNHEGILVLQGMGLDPTVGVDALELLHLQDQAAEVNVTPDRGYCLSLRGIAREYSHATGTAFRDPAQVQPEQVEGFRLAIEDLAPIRGKLGCDRFAVRAVGNIDPTQPTPPWMVSRLKLSGMRSISLIVDITNYVMLELGQPLHAYDLDKLTGGITVRRAKTGEILKTLDGQVRKLDVEDLLITDDSGPIGLAGVMGGEDTEVSSTTTSILIEAAHFDPVTIARSARRHKLPSEASKRFERGVDTAIAPYAIARVVQLLELHAAGSGADLGADLNLVEPGTPIALALDFAQSLVGVAYTEQEIIGALQIIGCSVQTLPNGQLAVTAPTWRSDLTHKTDLVEEVARINGYQRIGARLPVAPPGRGLTRNQKLRRNVLNALVGVSAVEVLNYPFASAAANRWFLSAETFAVRLANPIQEDAPELRLALLPGLLEAAKRNVSRGLTNIALFEEGSVFLPSGTVAKTADLPVGSKRPSQKEFDTLLSSIPKQPHHLAAVFVGERVEAQVAQKAIPFDFSDAIHAARVVIESVGARLTLRQSTAKGFHPGRTAELLVMHDGAPVVIGFAGELEPSLAIANDLPRRVAAFEIDLEKLFATAPESIQATPIYTYPAATQDLSLIVGRDVAAGEVLALISASAGELLEDVRLVDDYRGENVSVDKKSLTFALRFRAADRTLTQVEASEARNAAVAAAVQKFGAEIRA